MIRMPPPARARTREHPLTITATRCQLWSRRCRPLITDDFKLHTSVIAVPISGRGERERERETEGRESKNVAKGVSHVFFLICDSRTSPSSNESSIFQVLTPSELGLVCTNYTDTIVYHQQLHHTCAGSGDRRRARITHGQHLTIKWRTHHCPTPPCEPPHQQERNQGRQNEAATEGDRDRGRAKKEV